MVFNRIIDFYWYYIKNLKKHERKLLKYQGYGAKSIVRFKHETRLKWNTISKLLDSIKIVDGLELRNELRAIYFQNKELFDDRNTYVTHFGPIGKSGALIVNQFLRCFPSKERMVIPNSEINKLAENSSIIFLDDFIGTGNQGLEYVKKISYSLNSSIKPFLFTICGTEDGIRKIDNFGSNFKVKSQILLRKDEYYLLDKSNKILLDEEKAQIRTLNFYLGITESNEYHLGLPFAFYYSTPDNSLGILWNDNTEYKMNNTNRKWYGLVPREY